MFFVKIHPFAVDGPELGKCMHKFTIVILYAVILYALIVQNDMTGIKQGQRKMVVGLSIK